MAEEKIRICACCKRPLTSKEYQLCESCESKYYEDDKK